uniref:Metalloproteinase n=1 Tax=Rhipicephalus haemaphysaloides TaxID=237073 RepID=Q1ZZW9_RHIHE|nr:metalloproteinase [Rhipicephalus haemaphysaloides]
MLMFIVLLRLMLCCCAVMEEQHIYPHILDERSTSRNLVLKLSEKITLNLERSTVLADNLLFVTSSKDLHKVEMLDTSHIQQTIFHDTNYQSSVIVRQKDDNVEVEGIINDNLRIRPLPEGERSMDGQMLHAIYEVQPTKQNFNKTGHDFLHLARRNRADSNGYRGDISSLQARASGVQNFPVELHMISDKEHQRSYKNNEELISYLAVMMNAVTLRYLDMTNPKISFLLVGVTRAKDHDFGRNNGGEIEAAEMLRGLGQYKNQGRIPGNYDVVYLMTGLDMIRFSKGKKIKGIAGRAKMSTVCTERGLGEGEDTPHAYTGVNTLAHELAHTLGSDHDETPECPWADGYLMSYVDGGLRKYKLSRCSQNSIRQYVGRLSDKCIRVLNGQNYMKDRRKFPGQTIRKQYYCRKLMKKKARGQKVFVEKTTDCDIKCCRMGDGFMVCMTFKMLDGMTCMPGKTCKRGVCGYH